MTTEEDLTPCQMCSVPRTKHEDEERAGRIRHAWSGDGGFSESQLAGKTPSGARRMPGGGQQINVMVTPAPDVMLRELLVQKGLLTRADVDGLAMPIGQIRLPGAPQRPSGGHSEYEELDKDL